MAVDQIISLESKEGHEYLIKLDRLDPAILPDRINIPVVNITIEKVNGVDTINNAKTLFQITQAIAGYAFENDVVLYCYCDSAPISKRNPEMSSQEFRSLLFIKMFEKQNNNEYLNEQIIIDDPENGNHYIHLFSRMHHKDTIEIIASKLLEFNK